MILQNVERPQKPMEKSAFNLEGKTHNRTTDCTVNGQPCLRQDCKCCSWWLSFVNTMANVSDKCINVAIMIAENKAHDENTIQQLRANETALVDDNKRYKKANKKLNAKNNGIRQVPAFDKESTPGRIGRPKGQKATINKRPTNIDKHVTLDFDTCPECDKKHVSDITEHCDRVITHVRITVENVKYDTPRRYCRICKEQVKRDVPGVKKNARVSVNVCAAGASLNMAGVSHGKTAAFLTDLLGRKFTRSWCYRNKISTSEQLAPEYHDIWQKVQDASWLHADEFVQPIGKKNGYGIVVQDDKLAAVKIAGNRKIEQLEELLPDYKGGLTHDSLSAWQHIGTKRQMCLIHQIRIPKRDIKYHNPKGDVKTFLESLKRAFKNLHDANDIEDTHTRKVAANCFNAQLSDIIHGDYTDDEQLTIGRYRKRWYREGYHMTTSLSIKGIPRDNNAVERTNRKFACIKNDGGGNRSQKGMDANSVLYTIFATDKLIGANFFEHIVRASSGDG